MSLFAELKRRNVFRVGIAYVVATWVLLQITDVLTQILELPGWAPKLIFLILAIGFIPTLIAAWAFEMTPEGIKRERDVDRSQSITPYTGRKLDRAIIGVLVVALGLVVAERLALDRDSTPAVEKEQGSELFSQNHSETTPDTSIAKKDSGPSSSESELKSVAVLPFVNMSSDPEQEYFSDGLSEELLNLLVRNKDLHVAARTSSFQFKGQNLDISEIGRKLKVAHVLEGSVRKSANRLRITAQLIETVSGYHLWSETYEREMTDIFAIQDDISQAIARALELELGTSTKTGAEKPTDNLDAYNLYLQGRYFLAKRGQDGDSPLLQAIDLFKQAVELDPEFSEAWSGMAFSIALVPGYGGGISSIEAIRQTRNAANRAIALQAENAEAHAALGYTEGVTAWNWETAQEHFERAFALSRVISSAWNKSNAWPWNWTPSLVYIRLIWHTG
jgi:TolB-like protein